MSSLILTKKTTKLFLLKRPNNLNQNSYRKTQVPEISRFPRMVGKSLERINKSLTKLLKTDPKSMFHVSQKLGVSHGKTYLPK